MKNEFFFNNSGKIVMKISFYKCVYISFCRSLSLSLYISFCFDIGLAREHEKRNPHVYKKIRRQLSKLIKLYKYTVLN